ncbi:hypothetical protein [Pedobacter hartonius]|uniref:Uncharacterized protein n=1 Tax=Pedobacter hartonius TaxID=425514 RepID=A0A1H4AWJ8_9SPHI|nr:hypothetical protein [Pedobacter hartonius]SEA40022.1 hypothetical protein SAMN05443550_103111 [Pedobacter hartonius]
MPGTEPCKQGHFVAILEGREVLSSAEALHTHIVCSTGMCGQLLFNDLAIGKKEYIVGYGIDGYAGMETICATLILPAAAKKGVILPANLSNVFVSPDHIGTDLILAQLSIPFYYQERYSFKWIALFPGEFNDQMCHGKNVLAVSKSYIPQHCGNILLKNIPERLSRFETYTLVHGIGLDAFHVPDYSKQVSYCTFIVWRSNVYIGTTGVSSFYSKNYVNECVFAHL